jgi:hypothetical protein
MAGHDAGGRACACQINSCIFVDSAGENFPVVLRGIVFPSSPLAR